MKDHAMKFDDVKNEGFLYRAKWTAAGRTFQFMVPILLYVFMQEKYMIDNTDFMLTMQLNDPKFALQTFTDGKKYIIDVKNVSCTHVKSMSARVLLQGIIKVYKKWMPYTHTMGIEFICIWLKQVVQHI